MPQKKEAKNPAASMEKNEKKSYLDRLQFDPRLAASVVAKYITNIRVVFLLALTITLLGVASYFNLPKRLNPEVKIPIVRVVTTLPGASPQDVESLVTIPLENQLRGLKGLDQVTSVSNDNVSFITLQFFSQVQQDDAKKDVQSAVDSFTDLPSNAQKPSVTVLDFEDQPIWTFAVIGQKDDVHSLMTFSDELKKKISDQTKVDRVITSGYETQEVVVAIKPEKVQELGVNPLVLAQEIKKDTASYPAGSVKTTQNAFSLTINPSVNTIDDIRSVRLNVQGHTFTLGDVATVTQQSKQDEQHSYYVTPSSDPQRAVTFYVYKTSVSNIDEAGVQVKQVVNDIVKKYDNRFQIVTLSNTSEDIQKQFLDLLGEFRSTILLVFLCLFLFLGLRQAIISSFTVPLTFLSAFIFMRFFGMSINFLSLFAFLLALGLLVDDTIVTVSAMTTYYRTGKFTTKETGLLVWRDTIVPIWSTTITTIWSFVPLLLSTGIIGEFIKPIPIVVTVTMISSTAIAVLITLPVMMIILKPVIPKRITLMLKVLLLIISLVALFAFFSKNIFLPVIGILYLILLWVFYRILPVITERTRQFIKTNTVARKVVTTTGKYMDHGVVNIEPLSRGYYNVITTVLSSKSATRKVIFAIVLYAVVCFSLLPLGLVKNEFFPKSDQNEIFVNVELPSGATLEQAEKQALPLLNQLKTTQDSTFTIAEVGKSFDSTGLDSAMTNSVLFSVRLQDKENRNVKSMTIAQNLRDQFAHFTDGKVSVIEESGGPPAGADLQIKLLGDDLNTLDQYANKLTDYLKQQKEVTNVEKSVKSGTSRLAFVPDYAKLNDAGLSVDTVGLWLRMYATGFTLDSINFDKSRTDKTDIMFKLDGYDSHPEGMSQLSIPNATGTMVPLMSVGSLKLETNPTVITRQNGKRTISVSASMLDGFSATEENKKLEKFADSMNLPAGYSWETGGVNEENAKSVNSILEAMVLAFILILITMVIQFGSFRQAIIVLLVIPLAVSSVFLAFALFGIPLSFPALIGVLSLFGIVVTNSMFIVDKINLNLKQGMKLKEAIADAGSSRLEPIILTKLCTVLGLLPITLANPLWRGLGGAIISGLLFSSTIMLLFIPAVYYSWIGEEKHDKKSSTKSQ